MSRSYWYQLGIAVDQLLNAILAGHADETLSARAWRMRNIKRRWNIARQLIDGLFFWQDNHCYRAYKGEINRRHMPDYYR